LFLLAIGYYVVKSVRLPPNWGVSHIILLGVCGVVYSSAVWFCVSSLLVSISHEFNNEIVTRHSLLGFSWTRVKLRSDVQEARVIEASGSPFGSTGFLLQVVFKNDGIEPVFSSKDAAEVRAVQQRLDAYLRSDKTGN